LGQPANSIGILTSPSGKPYIDGATSLRFNLSHTDEIAVVAVGCSGEVGGDEEAMRVQFFVGEGRAWCTEGGRESAQRAASAADKSATFFRLWTRKEAVLKADGRGLDATLEKIDVSEGSGGLIRVSDGEQRLWKVYDLDVAPGYAGALAVPPGDWRVRWRDLG